MRHKWDEASDEALRQAHGAMVDLDLPRGVLWPAVAGRMAEAGVRITPAAASSRMYRLQRAAEEPEPVTTPEAAEAVEDAWARAERLVEEYEQSEREALTSALEGLQIIVGRVEMSTMGVEGRLGVLEDRLGRIEAGIASLLQVWQ